jgi:hypothetical protein
MHASLGPNFQMIDRKVVTFNQPWLGVRVTQGRAIVISETCRSSRWRTPAWSALVMPKFL